MSRKQSRMPRLTDFEVKEAETSKDAVDELEGQLDAVTDTDTFFLGRMSFPSENRGARSISKKRMQAIRELESELSAPELDKKLDEFEISMLDEILRTNGSMDKIIVWFMNENEINAIKRMQARFRSAFDNVAFPFKLGINYFHVLDMDVYRNIKKAISSARTEELDSIESFTQLPEFIDPLSEAEINYVMEKIKRSLSSRHSYLWYGRITGTIIELIESKFHEIPMSKPLLEKFNSFQQKLYIALQNSLLTGALKRIATKEGDLTEKTVEAINRVLRKTEKLDILGDEELKDKIRELRNLLGAGKPIGELKQYIESQISRNKRRSGLQLDV